MNFSVTTKSNKNKQDRTKKTSEQTRRRRNWERMLSIFDLLFETNQLA